MLRPSERKLQACRKDTEDLKLKGLDIAARAVSKLPHPTPHPFPSAPILYIRGAQPGTGAELQKKLQQYAAKRIDIRVFDYSSNESHIAEDIQSASVVMMPSRAEGFGLVAIEAIGPCVEFRVSQQSCD
jgi:glycosyltransferase involved in cell wall biosynthesis